MAEPAEKLSKASVNYQRGMAQSHCGPLERWPRGSCAHFRAPHGCELVKGAIERGGWCTKWKRPARHLARMPHGPTHRAGRDGRTCQGGAPAESPATPRGSVMAWGTHPDTLMNAAASHEADAFVCDRRSAEWRKVYIDAYEKMAPNDPGVIRYVTDYRAREAA